MRTIAAYIDPIRRLTTLLLLLAAGGLPACNRSSALPGDEQTAEYAVSIAYLKSLCTSARVTLTRDLSLECFVTANDAYGEYYRTLAVADATGGIEIALDKDDLWEEYERGTRLIVHCNGLALGQYGGKIQLGAALADDYAVDRIPEEQIGRHLRKLTGEPHAVVPEPIGFDGLDFRRVGCYVRFDGVRFAEAEQGEPFCLRSSETDRAIDTDRHLVDAGNDTLCVRISARCTYGFEPIPRGTGIVCGILDYFNGTYQLRITNRELDFRQLPD